MCGMKLSKALNNFQKTLIGEEMVVPGGIAVNDEVYSDLFKETGDHELDHLTEYCLRILCCSGAILLHCQLEDWLPAPEIVSETKNKPKHNILCEHDFAQLDRKLRESPQISSIALSEIVCFMNNKTPDYFTSLTEEERQNLIERAVTEKKEYIQWYQEIKHKMKKLNTALMGERQKVVRQAESKEKRKEDLVTKLQEYGGLWKT